VSLKASSLGSALKREFREKPIQTSAHLVVILSVVIGAVVASLPHFSIAAKVVGAIAVPLLVSAFAIRRAWGVLRTGQLSPSDDGLGMCLVSFYLSCVSLAVMLPMIKGTVENQQAQIDLLRDYVSLIGESYELTGDVARIEVLPIEQQEAERVRVMDQAASIKRVIAESLASSPSVEAKWNPLSVATPALIVSIGACSLYVGIVGAAIMMRIGELRSSPGSMSTATTV